MKKSAPTIPIMAGIVHKAITDVFQNVFPSSSFSLSKHQEQAILEFIIGKDTFVSLPTGHGKSIIYQLVIPIATKLVAENAYQDRVFPVKPVLLVVAPLRALVADQIKSCQVLGLSCIKLEDVVDECTAQLIFTSPEIMEQNLHLLRNLGDRFVGIVVDESHCVVNWGTTAMQGKNPFRIAYSRVGNVRAVIKAPILCLTATAIQKTRRKIINMLHMVKTKVIYLSPEKENIKYCVEQPVKGKTLEDTFGWLISDLRECRDKTKKTVIFCSSFKECGDIYDIFSECLPNTSHFAMFHAKTPDRLKESVLHDFIEADGKIRVVVATSALGMGVNIPNIRRVIHYGVPQDIEGYTQAVGRGGRDGGDVIAVLYYRHYHLRHCDDKMRQFVKNKEECRRLRVLKYFNQKPKKKLTLHRCCDVCSLQCNCGSCPEECHKAIAYSYDLDAKETLARHVSNEERETFVSVLKDIRKEQTEKGYTSVMGSKFFENMLSDGVIEDLANNLENLFSIKYVMEKFPILDERVATEILSVVDDIYKDVTEATSLKLLDFDDDFNSPNIIDSSCTNDTSSEDSS